MILTGIDMLEIARIKNSIKSNNFINHLFGSSEREEFEASACRAQKAASCFTAKEAFGKALGTGISGFLLKEVEVLHDEKGKPYFFLTGNAKRIAEKNELNISLSITHTEQFAAAVVVIYSDKERLCFD